MATVAATKVHRASAETARTEKVVVEEETMGRFLWILMMPVVLAALGVVMFYLSLPLR